MFATNNERSFFVGRAGLFAGVTTRLLRLMLHMPVSMFNVKSTGADVCYHICFTKLALFAECDKYRVCFQCSAGIGSGSVGRYVCVHGRE